VIKLRGIRWAGLWRRWWAGEAYTGFGWGNLKERERPLGKPRRRWEYNIKLEQKEVGCGA